MPVCLTESDLWTDMLCDSFFESYLGLTFETDGAVDAYWTCPGTDHDPWGSPSVFVAPYDNLSLPSCPWGTCTSLPADISTYVAQGGHTASGGNWSNTMPLATVCGLKEPDDCIMADWSAQETCTTSEWGPCEKLREGRDRDFDCSPLPKTSWTAEDKRVVYFTVLNT